MQCDGEMNLHSAFWRAEGSHEEIASTCWEMKFVQIIIFSINSINFIINNYTFLEIKEL